MAKCDNYDIQLGIQARVYSYSLLYDSSIIATNCFLSVKHPLYVCMCQTFNCVKTLSLRGLQFPLL